MDSPAKTPDSRFVRTTRGDSFFIRATVHRPVTLLMLFLALVVVGTAAYLRIEMHLTPPGLSSGELSVHIPVPDATPREVMDRVAKPCEDLLRVIPGIERIVSSSSARFCRIRVQVDPEADMTVVLAEVRDRMDRAKPQWPEGVDDYFLWRESAAAMPVYVAAVSLAVDEDKVDIDQLFEDVIRRRLEAVDGVARVDIWGVLTKRVEIGLDPDRVDMHKIPLYDLVQRLGADNRGVSIGSVREGEKDIFVVADGKFTDFQSVLDYPATESFRIKDFAQVEYVYAVKEFLSRANGHLSRVIAVNKASNANTIEVCARIDAALKELEETLGRTVPTLEGITAHAWLNQGDLIRFSIQSLQETALWGGLLAVLVLYAFLRRVGMTLLVTLAIPVSMLVAIVWIFFYGGTFNLLSLMGLSLGIGMLVDNSIVIVENILRHREAGLAPKAAAIKGVREVGLAVTLATLTTVMVFLPILFIGDPRFKVIATEIGMPVCVSVLGSLLVALVFIPQGSLFLTWRDPVPRESARSQQVSWFNRAVGRGVDWALRRRVETMVLVLLLFGATWLAFQGIPKTSANTQGQTRLEVRLTLPKNFTLTEAEAVFAKVENKVLEHREELNIRSTTAWFRAHGGDLAMYLEYGARVDQVEFFARVREILPELPGVTYRMGYEDFASDEVNPRLRVYVRGNDLETLERLGAAVRAELQDRDRFPELLEVNEWRSSEQAEVRVRVQRGLAQEYDITTAAVSRMVAWALRGAPLPDFETAEQERPFWIAYEGGPQDNLRNLDGIRVFTPEGETVRLENLATYDLLPGLGEIHRVDGVMTLGFSTAIQGDKEAAKAVRARVARHFSQFPVPDGFDVSLRRADDRVDTEITNALMALGMAFALVFFIMGILFESFLLPLSVLASIPFAFVGSVFLLWALEMQLDVVGMIGILMLVGIVVNNAIVLVDYINRLRSTGLPRDTAILRACSVRFRPIWMTALTTVFGLAPLLFLPQHGEGVDYKPLATVLVGGLATSTFFTLLLVPVVYAGIDDLRAYFRRWIGLSTRNLWRRGTLRASEL